MGVIALLTDYGLKDPYVARLKGKLLTLDSSLEYVDISHEVDKFHLPQAAYLLGNVWRDFPEGSVFLVGVEHPYEFSNYIICESENRFFIAPNNGLLSLLRNNSRSNSIEFENIIELSFDEKSSFVFYQNILELGVRIQNGERTSSLGKSIEDIKRFTLDEIKFENNELTGKVLFVDSYGNIITNIHKDIIEVNGVGRSYEILVGREYISRVDTNYQIGAEARCIALFNVDGFLEIAITDANASELLGVKGEASLSFDNKIKQASDELGVRYDSPVTIKFTNQQQPLL